MSSGAHTGLQRPVRWNFALHSCRWSLIVIFWSHCNSCINLKRKNHCCRDELCSSSCPEPQPSVDVEHHHSPQMEACSVQMRALDTEDYICEAFNTLVGGWCEGSLMFFSQKLYVKHWTAKVAEVPVHMVRMCSARLWHALLWWGLAGWVSPNGKPVSPEIKELCRNHRKWQMT